MEVALQSFVEFFRRGYFLFEDPSSYCLVYGLIRNFSIQDRSRCSFEVAGLVNYGATPVKCEKPNIQVVFRESVVRIGLTPHPVLA